MYGTRVRSLVQEDPTYRGATKPISHNYWDWVPQLPKPACPRAHMLQLLKPTCSRAHVPQLLSPCAATNEARAPRACAPQQEKPSRWEARAPQPRVALLAATRESLCAATKTQCRQKFKKIIIKDFKSKYTSPKGKETHIFCYQKQYSKKIFFSL